MQVGGVSLDLKLIRHEQAFGDYLTDHSFSLWKVWAGEKANRAPDVQCNDVWSLHVMPSARLLLEPN